MTDSSPVERGELINAGKTKEIYRAVHDPRYAVVKSKCDVTAGNGARHDVIEGKDFLANIITCNVFERLERELGSNLFAYVGRNDATSFVAEQCHMFPFEVVIRREVAGSYPKRNPGVEVGTRFPRPIVEWHLKTKDRRWEEHGLPEDDPFVVFQEVGLGLHRSDKPFDAKNPFLVLDDVPFLGIVSMREALESTAVDVFLALEAAWAALEGNLLDLKIEFGQTLGHADLDQDQRFDLARALDSDAAPRVVVADVIDHESWRLKRKGRHLDKQPYRNGCTPEEFLSICQEVAELTSRF